MGDLQDPKKKTHNSYGKKNGTFYVPPFEDPGMTIDHQRMVW